MISGMSTSAGDAIAAELADLARNSPLAEGAFQALVHDVEHFSGQNDEACAHCVPS
jgi:hypothetical protein